MEDDFVQGDKKPVQSADNTMKTASDDASQNQTMLTINEEVTIFEYAPKKF